MPQRAFSGGWFIFFPFLCPQSMFLKTITQHPRVAGNSLLVITDTYFDILWQSTFITPHFAVLADQRILVIALVRGRVINGRQLVVLASASLLGHLCWLWCRMYRTHWWQWWRVKIFLPVFIGSFGVWWSGDGKRIQQLGWIWGINNVVIFYKLRCIMYQLCLNFSGSEDDIKNPTKAKWNFIVP